MIITFFSCIGGLGVSLFVKKKLICHSLSLIIYVFKLFRLYKFVFLYL